MTPKITGTNTEYRVFGQLTSVKDIIRFINLPIIKKYRFVPILLLSFVLLLFTGCNKPLPTENPYREGQIEISMLETACTEALLKITVKGMPLPVECNFSINKQILFPLILRTADTTIVVDSLNASSDYQILISVNAGSPQVINDSIAFRTPDSSSHTIVWQGYEFGASYGSTSVLNDVGIIDDNNIWAVGVVHSLDSIGRVEDGYYNLLKWNGINWTKHRIYFDWQGQEVIGPIYSIYVLSKNEVLFSSSVVKVYSYGKWTQLNPSVSAWPNESAYKIWGLSTENFYIGGEGGAIAHYYKGEWKKIESGTNLDIVGMTGYYDANTQQTVVFCTASIYGGDQPHKIIRIVNDKPEIYSSEGIESYHLQGIFASNPRRIYSGAWGIYMNRPDQNPTKWIRKREVQTQYSINDIDGYCDQDIYYCGAFGDIGHYNGISWTNYIQNGQLPVQYMSLYNIAAKGKIVCAVGLFAKAGTPGLGYAYIGKK